MNSLNQKSVIGVAALLVHAAKIDEQYSDNEKHLVREFISSYLKNANLTDILTQAEEIEKNSNQLLSLSLIHI